MQVLGFDIVLAVIKITLVSEYFSFCLFILGLRTSFELIFKNDNKIGHGLHSTLLFTSGPVFFPLTNPNAIVSNPARDIPAFYHLRAP